jgi:hypothetical protein
MAVVQENRYRLLKPRSGQNQIRGVVAIDVSRHDFQAASGCDDQNRLALGCGDLKLNPVVG